MRGKVLWHTTMSLDGFVAGPHDEVDWVFEHAGPNAGPIFVVTHDPPTAPEDPAVTFLSGDLREAAGTALTAAEGKNVVVIGANLGQRCVEEGVIDEIVIHLAPVLLGDGVRLFERPDAGRIKLERTSLAQSGQVTDLRFRVVK
jgi:dihydrofolate reductase